VEKLKFFFFHVLSSLMFLWLARRERFQTIVEWSAGLGRWSENWHYRLKEIIV
jgi:hypothetical protein